jgi:hypothetical protein
MVVLQGMGPHLKSTQQNNNLLHTSVSSVLERWPDDDNIFKQNNKHFLSFSVYKLIIIFCAVFDFELPNKP